MSSGEGSQDHPYDMTGGTAATAADSPDAASFGAIEGSTTIRTSGTEAALPGESRTNDPDGNINDIATSVAKLSNEDDVARVVAEALEKEEEENAMDAPGEEQQQQQSAPTEQGQGDEALFSGSATGDESGDTGTSNNPLNEDDDADVVMCQPVTPNTSLAASEFHSAVGTTPTDASAVVPTHRRTNSDSSRKKRLCRFPGCTRVIKSQGHCQRHGAKAKRCKVEGCEKQAQGTHNGMCKRHWRAVHFPDQVAAKAEAAKRKEMEEQPPPPYGESVYDNVLPASIAYRPSFASHQLQMEKANATATSQASDNAATVDHLSAPSPVADASKAVAATTNAAPSIVSAMPLVNFLRDGALHKEIGWHRQAERRARGILQISNLAIQLEPWEKQLALVEILLLSGGTPHANFRDLAHAWGRERGFHQVLASTVCTRRGEVERKKRSDAGSGKKSAARGLAPPTKRAKPTTPAVPMYHPAPTQHPQQQVLPQQQQQQPLAPQVAPQAPTQQTYAPPVVPWHQQPLQQQQPVAEVQHLQPQQAQIQQSEVQQIENSSSATSYN